MHKFKKKPVVVEAFQMTKERRWNNLEWPNWLHKAWNKEPSEGALWIDDKCPNREKLVCGTLEGVHHITFGDYIIQGVKGEIYPCKPEIFEMTYAKENSEEEDVKRKAKFEEAVKPLMKFLCENHHPHMEAIVCGNMAKLVEGHQVFKTDQFVVD